MFSNVNSFKKWKEFASAFDFRCVYCGFDFLSSPHAYVSSVREHFKPKVKGGAELVLACQLCNIVKGKRTFNTIEEAKKEIKILREKYLEKYEFEKIKARRQ